MRRKLGLLGVVLVLVVIICSVVAIGLLSVMGRGGGEEFVGVVGSLGSESMEVEVTRVVREEMVERAAADVSLVSDNALASSLAERLIIRNASLGLVVRDTEAALDEVNALVDELGGYVVSSQLSKYEEGVRASLTARVPAAALETALARLRDLALEVRYQNVSGQDVTEEFVDLGAQLRHLEATEAQLLRFLEEAEDTEATLAVYGELRGAQGEVERIKGRMQYLEQASALSTISVELIPDEMAEPISVGGWRPGGTLRRALQTLIRTLQFLVDVLVWVVVYILPVGLLVLGLPAGVVAWLVRRWRRGRG